MKNKSSFFLIPYLMWLLLFVAMPIILLTVNAFTDTQGQISLTNLRAFLANGACLKMMVNSFWYALLITGLTLLVSYPLALVIANCRHQRLWLLLVILPTWINLLLKTYAFIGLLGQHGLVNQALQFFGVAPRQLLFTKAAFVVVAAYIEIPFMVLPIYDSLHALDKQIVAAARDLGANAWQTFWRVIWPLTLPGVRAGVQAVFIPSLSLFMITRLIGGNKVITLGTAIEEYFLTTMNWHMGSMIGVILIVIMVLVLLATSGKEQNR
ncbi:MAG: ABC transporter permease [Lactobacillus sp.]|nr:ABC transporter permease [Lactobacillus sp.]MCH3906560.1 ABC transporter permease [Lactobacillus sp.]MCI1466326.1 ABC transporter permease [Lactobacillus sp.]MCI1481906.1 ABC transporter permease [Lactobacillus sp.]MCI1883297.1 ABC transporter permease [Lactobacillus sp.]